MRGKPGDAIVRAGDVANEMFVVLAGTVEVRGDADGVEHTIASFGRGEVFGEIGFLGGAQRIATVVAASDLEVLVLTQGFCRKAMYTMPEVTVKVLLNLSLILCERLRTSTENLLGAGADATTASIRYGGSSSNIASPTGVISRRTARRSELPRKRRTYPFPSSAISVCEIVPLSTPGNRRASWDCASNGWRSRRNAGPPIAPD